MGRDAHTRCSALELNACTWQKVTRCVSSIAVQEHDTSIFSEAPGLDLKHRLRPQISEATKQYMHNHLLLHFSSTWH
jgi:hypothetical protein